MSSMLSTAFQIGQSLGSAPFQGLANRRAEAREERQLGLNEKLGQAQIMDIASLTKKRETEAKVEEEFLKLISGEGGQDLLGKIATGINGAQARRGPAVGVDLLFGSLNQQSERQRMSQLSRVNGMVEQLMNSGLAQPAAEALSTLGVDSNGILSQLGSDDLERVFLALQNVGMQASGAQDPGAAFVQQMQQRHAARPTASQRALQAFTEGGQ